MFIRIVRGIAAAVVLTSWLGMAAPLGAAEHDAAATSGAGHAGAGHGGESGAAEINPLNFQTDLAIWTAVIFLVVLAILGKFAWRPMAEGLDKREQRIADQIAQAEQANQQARHLLAEYEGRLTAAQDEVRTILEAGRRDAEQLGRQMLDKAREDIKAEHSRAKEQIEAATAGALKELADRGAELAVQLAGRILRTELRPEKHTELIQQAVAGFVKGDKGRL